MEEGANPAYRFGDYLLTPDEQQLTYEGEKTELRPKTFEVLLYLVQHAGHVVEREDLFRSIWPQTHVTQTVLDHSIWEIRQALNDHSEAANWIETLPKIGYRFAGEVERIPTREPRPNLRRRILLLGALCAPLMVLTLWYFGLLFREADSIAILPFVNDSGDEDSEYLASGIPERISARLTRIPSLKVIATSVLHRYRGQKVDVRKVVEELNVRYVLTGNVLLNDKTLVVRTELVDGRDNSAIWKQPYSGNFKDIIAVEVDIARRVADALLIELTDKERERLVQSGTSDPEAYQAFLRAEYHSNRWENKDPEKAWRIAITHYEWALEEDPRYQEAYHSLGWCYFWLARQFTQSQEDFVRAREYWEKLIQVDESTSLAHATKAFILWAYDKEWGQAEKEYVKAEELVPSWEIWSFGDFTDWMGLEEERLAQIERLLERSDPFSASQQCYAGWAFLWRRDYDRAVEQAKKTLELEPDSRQAYTLLAFSYGQKGMEKEAFEAGQKSRMVLGASQEELTARKEAFEKSGLEGVWRWQLDRLLSKNKHRPLGMVKCCTKLGYKDQAFEWLEKTWNQPLHGFAHAPSSFDYDPLRDDPRFEALLRKLNLPEVAIQRHLWNRPSHPKTRGQEPGTTGRSGRRF